MIMKNKIITGAEYNYIINPNNKDEEFLYEIIIGLKYEDKWRDAIIMPIYNTYKESLKENFNFEKLFEDIKDILNEEFGEYFKIDEVFDWCSNIGCWFIVDYQNLEETEYFRDEVPISGEDITDNFDIEDINEMFK